jgi:hypothetical protein
MRRDNREWSLLAQWFAIFAIFSTGLIVACQSLQPPQTTEDRIQYAKASLTATYKSIDDLAVRKRITRAEGLQFLARADEARSIIMSAEGALSSGSVNVANAHLGAATSLLEALQSTLKKRGAQ